MSPLEIALFVTSLLFGFSAVAGAYAAGHYRGSWLAQRETIKVLERVYEHVRIQLGPLEDTPAANVAPIKRGL